MATTTDPPFKFSWNQGKNICITWFNITVNTISNWCHFGSIHVTFCLKLTIDYSCSGHFRIKVRLGWISTTAVRVTHFCKVQSAGTQQNYYGRQCGTLLHSYCTGTYTEVTMLLLWGNSAVTMECPHSYSVGVSAWVLQGSIGATSKKQHCYFSEGTSEVTVW